MERGTEETGRFLIWPEVIKEFLSSPLVGLGAANSAVILQGEWHPRTPHNTFLFFAISSGIVPPLLFISFWIAALRKSFAGIEQQEYGPFRAPLLMYVLVISITGDLGFTFPTGLLGLAIGTGAGASYRLPRLLAVAKDQQRHMYKVRRLRPGAAAFVARRRF
jgi:O-antigen ligase